MNEEIRIKKNSIIEALYKSNPYKPLIDFLKKNLDRLSDFIISEKEILEIVDQFDYQAFIKEFNETKEFANLSFLRNKYDAKVFHIVIKGKSIPEKYTESVIRWIAENEGYSTKNIKEIINKDKTLDDEAEKELKKINARQRKSKFSSHNNNRRSENFSAYSPNTITLDGSYGTHMYKSQNDGRYYDNASHDDYSHDSNA